MKITSHKSITSSCPQNWFFAIIKKKNKKQIQNICPGQQKFKKYPNAWWMGRTSWMFLEGWISPHLLDHQESLWKTRKKFDFLKVYNEQEESRILRLPELFSHGEMDIWKKGPGAWRSQISWFIINFWNKKNCFGFSQWFLVI